MRRAGLLILIFAALAIGAWWWTQPTQRQRAVAEEQAAIRSSTLLQRTTELSPPEPSRAPTPADRGVTTVSCLLPAEARDVDSVTLFARRELSEAQAAAKPGRPGMHQPMRKIAGRVLGAKAEFQLRAQDSLFSDPATWESASIRLSGFVRADVTLQRVSDLAWTCEIPALSRVTEVVGEVKLPPGTDVRRVWITGCGQPVQPDSSGSFYLETDGKPCTLQASRRDGNYVARGAPVEVKPRSGQEIIIDLDIPAAQAGGIGTQIREGDGGIEIIGVLPGSPAEEAGLQTGDVVVRLDGADVTGWNTEEFIDIAVGPVGTDVTYTVLREGQEMSWTMTRRARDDR